MGKNNILINEQGSRRERFVDPEVLQERPQVLPARLVPSQRRPESVAVHRILSDLHLPPPSLRPRGDPRVPLRVGPRYSASVPPTAAQPQPREQLAHALLHRQRQQRKLSHEQVAVAVLVREHRAERVRAHALQRDDPFQDAFFLDADIRVAPRQLRRALNGPRAGVREIARALHRGSVRRAGGVARGGAGAVVFRELVPGSASLELPTEHDLLPLLGGSPSFERDLGARHPPRAVGVRTPVPFISGAGEPIGRDELHRDRLIARRRPRARVGAEANDAIHEMRGEDVIVDRLTRARLALPDDGVTAGRAPRGPRRAVGLVSKPRAPLLRLKLFRDAEPAVVAHAARARVASLAHRLVGCRVPDVRFAAGHRDGLLPPIVGLAAGGLERGGAGGARRRRRGAAATRARAHRSRRRHLAGRRDGERADPRLARRRLRPLRPPVDPRELGAPRPGGAAGAAGAH